MGSHLPSVEESAETERSSGAQLERRPRGRQRGKAPGRASRKHRDWALRGEEHLRSLSGAGPLPGLCSADRATSGTPQRKQRGPHGGKDIDAKLPGDQGKKGNL